MFARINSLGVYALNGFSVSVEADISGGLPQFTIVGLPDSAVREATDRVRSALKNLSFVWPVSRITVNLAPGDIRKTGPVYDLPVLLAILAASGQLPVPGPEDAFIGELSLDGGVRSVMGVLPMALAAAADGVTVWMQSGYRSVDYQKNLYDKKTQYFLEKGLSRDEALKQAATIVNPPGYSEHNCGLAADLNSPEHTTLDTGFADTAAFRWLCENAEQYGFILRYPKEAESVTGITYEPWHWRYVGVENALAIRASGLSLEEFIALQRAD